jgi:hypothetical protein
MKSWGNFSERLGIAKGTPAEPFFIDLKFRKEGGEQ